LYVVDIQPYKRLNKKLTLSEIKKMKEFQDFYLVKMPRLSVMEVPDDLANLILKLTE
jgi:predicted RNA-binding protein with PUA-like domain